MTQNFKILNDSINATVTERNNQIELYLDGNLLFVQDVDYTSLNDVVKSVQDCKTIEELLFDFLGLEFDIAVCSDDIHDLNENEIADFHRTYMKIGPYHILSFA